jgi:hypothetical protein
VVEIFNIIGDQSELPILIVLDTSDGLFFNGGENKISITQSNNTLSLLHSLIGKFNNRTYLSLHYEYTVSQKKKQFNNLVSDYHQKYNMLKVPRSRQMDAEDMLKLFQSADLPIECWDHYGRLRVVFLYLEKWGSDIGFDNLAQDWKTYKTSIGHGHLWHYTMTRFWCLIIWTLMMKDCEINKEINSGFQSLYNKHPEIHNGKLFFTYYSKEVGFSDLARKQWVEPDLVTDCFPDEIVLGLS